MTHSYYVVRLALIDHSSINLSSLRRPSPLRWQSRAFQARGLERDMGRRRQQGRGKPGPPLERVLFYWCVSKTTPQIHWELIRDHTCCVASMRSCPVGSAGLGQPQPLSSDSPHSVAQLWGEMGGHTESSSSITTVKDITSKTTWEGRKVQRTMEIQSSTTSFQLGMASREGKLCYGQVSAWEGVRHTARRQRKPIPVESFRWRAYDAGLSWKLPPSILTITLGNGYPPQFTGEEAEAWRFQGGE